MMEIITDYFIKITSVKGGFQINLSYAMAVIFLWLSWELGKRVKWAFRQ